MDKAKKVMTAIKDRASVGVKKGVSLLGIVQKLSKKRQASADGKGGCKK
jgi:hypothetical protein